MGTWWIDEPILLGSHNPTEAELAQLRGNGFAVLVCLLDESQQKPQYDAAKIGEAGWTRHTIGVRDFHAPSLEQLNQFIKVIRQLPPRTKTIVHCWGGSGRTGTMGAAYWIARGMSAAEGITRVRKTNSHAVETAEQEAVLCEFERSRRADGSELSGRGDR